MANHLSHDTKSRIVRLDARPEPIAIDPACTAVLVVDMQNDFGAKGGLFDRAGIDISGIQKVIAPTAHVLASARNAGVKIIYLKMGFRPDLSDLGAPDSVNRVRHLRAGVGQTVRAPDGSESRMLIRDTLKKRPRDAFWRYLLGLALLKSGEAKESVKVLEDLADCEQFETDPNFWQYLGDAHQKSGQRDRARSAWEKALRAVPPTAEQDDRRRQKIERQLKGL